MKLGYLIVILSLGVIVIGITLMMISGINASSPFLNQNMLVTNGILKSKQVKTGQLNVIERGPAMYVIVKSDPSNVPLNAIVKDPSGSIISSSSFSQDLVADFKTERLGKYNLIIMNQGNADVSVNALLGYLPSFGANETPNYNALSGIFLGASLVLLGSFGFVAGLFISAKNKSSSERVKNAYRFLNVISNEIISSLYSRYWKLKKPSNTIHCDLISHRLGEFDKVKQGKIEESRFGEVKRKLTEDEESSFNT